jgi:hypothetical protein
MAKGDYEERCMMALSEARAYINKHGAYYAKIIYGLVPYFVPGFHTLAVTRGLVLLIDPVWYVEMEKEITDANGDKEERATAMRASVLVHEAHHILRDVSRLDVLPNPSLANIAGDIPINDGLAEITGSGGKKIWPLPKWVVYSSTYGFEKGLTLEQYYELLEKNAKQLLKKGLLSESDIGIGSGGSGGSGSGDDDSRASGASGGSSASGDEGPESRRGVGSGRCGSCAGGGVDKELEKKVDGEVGRNKADVQRIRKEAAKEVRDAIANGRGTVPGSLKELLDEPDRKSTINWRSRCSRIIRRATGRIACGQADFSLKRPSKRSYTRGIIRPGMIDRKVEVAIIEDSSGSMGREQLIEARVQATGVFEQLGVSEGWFLDADTEVAHDPVRLSMRKIASHPVHGRGGTDFRPALKAVLGLRPKPDIVFYMTDGDGVAPTEPPKGVEVVWCIVPTPYGRRPATWGHLVVVSDDQKLSEPYMSDEW